MRSMMPAQSFAWTVVMVRCPDLAAERNAWISSGSRISPTRMVLGCWRRPELSPLMKLWVSEPTSRWMKKVPLPLGSLLSKRYSTGDSRVRMLCPRRRPVFLSILPPLSWISRRRDAQRVVLPEPVGPETMIAPLGSCAWRVMMSGVPYSLGSPM